MNRITVTPEQIKENDKLAKQGLTEWERLSERQKSVVLIMGRSPGIPLIKACRDAGYVLNSKSRASAIQKSIEGKLGETFKNLFGVTEYDLLSVFVEAMKAEKTAVITEKEYYPNGKLKSEKSKVVSIGPDHGIRTKTAMFVAKLGNYEPVSKMKVDHNHKHSVFQNDTLEQLKARERNQTAQLTGFEVVNESVVN